jgi:hypothetical protein
MIRLSLAAVAVLTWSSASAADLAIVPDPTMTPGVARTTDAGEICSHGTRDLRY